MNNRRQENLDKIGRVTNGNHWGFWGRTCRRSDFTSVASYFLCEQGCRTIRQEQKINFQSVTAKLLHIVKRGLPDMEILVSFLTTRVTKSNVDNWEKLKRGLKYVKNKIKDKITIGAKTLSDLYMWIYAEYDVHNNIRWHTGGTMSMGYGIIHGKALK